MSSNHETEENIMKTIIKNNVHPTNPDDKINLVIYYKSPKTSDLILRNKPTTTCRKSTSRDHVIYQHTCNSVDCGPHTYVGKTQTSLSRRMTMHLQSGAIQEHYRGPHHRKLSREDLENCTIILDQEQDNRRLSYLEAIYIEQLQPTINNQTQDLQILPSKKRLLSNNSTSSSIQPIETTNQRGLSTSPPSPPRAIRRSARIRDQRQPIRDQD